jgi:hypothetical protein
VEGCPIGDRGWVTGRGIVKDDHLMTGRQKGLDRDGADIASATRDQDPYHGRNDTGYG